MATQPTSACKDMEPYSEGRPRWWNNFVHTATTPPHFSSHSSWHLLTYLMVPHPFHLVSLVPHGQTIVNRAELVVGLVPPSSLFPHSVTNLCDCHNLLAPLHIPVDRSTYPHYPSSHSLLALSSSLVIVRRSFILSYNAMKKPLHAPTLADFDFI